MKRINCIMLFLTLHFHPGLSLLGSRWGPRPRQMLFGFPPGRTLPTQAALSCSTRVTPIEGPTLAIALVGVVRRHRHVGRRARSLSAWYHLGSWGDLGGTTSCRESTHLPRLPNHYLFVVVAATSVCTRRPTPSPCTSASGQHSEALDGVGTASRFVSARPPSDLGLLGYHHP